MSGRPSDAAREIAALRARIAELRAVACEQKHFEEALRDSEGQVRALLVQFQCLVQEGGLRLATERD